MVNLTVIDMIRTGENIGRLQKQGVALPNIDNLVVLAVVLVVKRTQFALQICGSAHGGARCPGDILRRPKRSVDQQAVNPTHRNTADLRPAPSAFRLRVLELANLKLIPLVFAGWLLHLLGVDDASNAFTHSSDPLLEERRINSPVRPHIPVHVSG